ncbi:flagellar hook-basal body complex protein [Sulfurimonas sp. SAG-AH-194-L11]|nr:flagellar hook-basal body complex protein [Sulfurimonas sp. SAG-AH-194-L11]MDF1876291.1 flagellar hook-basal body complex protein [Sulfurimonas sp. SAG-AH-194-L11]
MAIQAFYTGISGLQNSSLGIDVISNNIANINTVGYRGYTTEFSSMFEDAIKTGTVSGGSIGSGVQVQTTSMMRDQGTLALSDRSTDLAILGEGWFGVAGEGDPLYTRDGSFGFDSNSDLVTSDGFYVLGTKGNNISDDNILTAKIDEITLGEVTTQERLRFPKTLTYPAEATTQSKFLGNIGVGYEPITMSAAVVDSLGNRNQLRLEFIKDPTQIAPGSQYTVTATTQTLDGETVSDTQVGRVEFDETGALSLNTLGNINNNGADMAIDLGIGFDGITSIDLPLVSASSISDGTIGGDLVGYSINRNAEVIATFTNGEQSSVGKIAVYHFQNEQGLDRVNGTRFSASSNSGDALFRQDANGNNINGTEVVNFSLESSNIELSYGLTELIILQRSYDANSKSITTADEMMQKALSMGA